MIDLERIDDLCQRLALGTMATQSATRRRRGCAEEWSYQEFFERLLQAEFRERQERSRRYLPRPPAFRRSRRSTNTISTSRPVRQIAQFNELASLTFVETSRERCAARSMRRRQDASRRCARIQGHAIRHQRPASFPPPTSCCSSRRRIGTGDSSNIYDAQSKPQAAHHRRSRLSAVLARRSQPFLPSDRPTLRTRLGHHHQQPSVRAVGYGLRRRRDDDGGDARSPAASCAHRDDHRRELPATRAQEGGNQTSRRKIHGQGGSKLNRRSPGLSGSIFARR